MPQTVSDLIQSSFRLIGTVAAAEVLETNELNDALISLNQMISSWNTEGASLFGRERITVSVNTGANSYALSKRPQHIESASVAISGIDSELEIVDSAGWEQVPEKAMSSVYIKKLFCDYAYPNSQVYIWPTPRLTGTLEVWIYTILTQFASLTTTIDLPPGYEQALRYNFAVAMLPEYPREQADPSLPAQAQMYKASIVQLNTGNHMTSRAGLPGPPAAA